MRPFLLWTAIGILCSAASAQITPPPAVRPGGTYFGTPKPKCMPDPVEPKSPRLPKNLTIESSGENGKLHAEGFEASPGYRSADWFNLQDLECYGCAMHQGTRSGATMAPFGSTVTLHLSKRFQLFGGVGGLEAPLAAGTPSPAGARLYGNDDDDNWRVQVDAGAKIAVDPHQHLWLGGDARHVLNFGGGAKEWNTFSGSATIRLGHQGR